MDDNINNLGSSLQYIRKTEKKMSIRKLAELSDVSHSYISQIENDKLTNPPKPSVISKLAEGLSEGNENEFKVIYNTLMLEAGYLNRAKEIDYINEKYIDIVLRIKNNEIEISKFHKRQQNLIKDFESVKLNFEKILESKNSNAEKLVELENNFSQINKELEEINLSLSPLYNERTRLLEESNKLSIILDTDLTSVRSAKIDVAEILKSNKDIFFNGINISEEKRKRIYQSIELILYLD